MKKSFYSHDNMIFPPIHLRILPQNVSSHSVSVPLRVRLHYASDPPPDLVLRGTNPLLKVIKLSCI